MLGRRCSAQMRLQCDVAKVLERDDPQGIRVTQDAGDRHRHRAVQPGHIGKWQLLELDALGMDGKDLRRRVAEQQSKVPPVGRVARERDDFRIVGGETGVGQKTIDACADVVVAHLFYSEAIARSSIRFSPGISTSVATRIVTPCQDVSPGMRTLSVTTHSRTIAPSSTTTSSQRRDRSTRAEECTCALDDTPLAPSRSMNRSEVSR